MSAQDEESFFVDTLAEYQWARDAAGLAPSTSHHLVKPVIEVCEYYGTVPWRLTPREVDKYFAGAGKRAQSTLRNKITKIDGYFAFLEQRYLHGETMGEPRIATLSGPRHRIGRRRGARPAFAVVIVIVIVGSFRRCLLDKGHRDTPPEDEITFFAHHPHSCGADGGRPGVASISSPEEHGDG
jgi:hypothetical protein